MADAPQTTDSRHLTSREQRIFDRALRRSVRILRDGSAPESTKKPRTSRVRDHGNGRSNEAGSMLADFAAGALAFLPARRVGRLYYGAARRIMA